MTLNGNFIDFKISKLIFIPAEKELAVHTAKLASQRIGAIENFRFL